MQLQFLRLLMMNSFLKEVREKLINNSVNSESVLVVIGNESVDLDSAVSSISLAYHLNRYPQSHIIPQRYRNSSLIVAPVINAIKDHIPLKTEVTYWLKEHGIDSSILIAKDEIDLKKIKNFILVDHHVSPYRQKVIAVLDHRPFDEKSNLNGDCYTNIQEVGSCATLVADVIRKDVKEEMSQQCQEVYELLYGTIVLDTINFAKEADKVRPLDEDVGNFIDENLGNQDIEIHRKKIYDDLVFARADISSLNSLQLLSKDLKIITSDDGKIRIAIPGVPVFKIISMENAEENIRKFASDENLDVVVLMGMTPVGNSIERFVGVIDIKNPALFHDVIDAMKAMETPILNLQEKEKNFMNGKFYQQMNIKPSRKQILPVLKQLISQYVN